MATATQNIQNTVNRAVSDARAGDFDALKKDVSVAAQQASQIANKQLGKARSLAKDNPVAAASICFGVGAFVGAAESAFRRSGGTIGSGSSAIGAISSVTSSPTCAPAASRSFWSTLSQWPPLPSGSSVA